MNTHEFPPPQSGRDENSSGGGPSNTVTDVGREYMMTDQMDALWNIQPGGGAHDMYNNIYPPPPSDVEGLIRDRDAKIQDLETKLLKAKEELQKQFRFVNESHTNNQQLVMEAAADKRKVGDLEAENRDLSKKLEQVSSSAKNVLAYCDRVKQKETAWEAARTQMEAEIVDNRKALKSLQESLDASRGVEQNLARENGRLSGECRSATERVTELESQVREAKERIAVLECEAQEIRDVPPTVITDPSCLCAGIRARFPQVTKTTLYQLVSRGWQTTQKSHVGVETQALAMCDGHCQTQDVMILDNSAQTDLIMDEFVNELQRLARQSGPLYRHPDQPVVPASHHHHHHAQYHTQFPRGNTAPNLSLSHFSACSSSSTNANNNSNKMDEGAQAHYEPPQSRGMNHVPPASYSPSHFFQHPGSVAFRESPAHNRTTPVPDKAIPLGPQQTSPVLDPSSSPLAHLAEGDAFAMQERLLRQSLGHLNPSAGPDRASSRQPLSVRFVPGSRSMQTSPVVLCVDDDPPALPQDVQGIDVFNSSPRAPLSLPGVSPRRDAAKSPMGHVEHSPHPGSSTNSSTFGTRKRQSAPSPADNARFQVASETTRADAAEGTSHSLENTATTKRRRTSSNSLTPVHGMMPGIEGPQGGGPQGGATNGGTSLATGSVNEQSKSANASAPLRPTAATTTTQNSLAQSMTAAPDKSPKDPVNPPGRESQRTSSAAPYATASSASPQSGSNSKRSTLAIPSDGLDPNWSDAESSELFGTDEEDIYDEPQTKRVGATNTRATKNAKKAQQETSTPASPGGAASAADMAAVEELLTGGLKAPPGRRSGQQDVEVLGSKAGTNGGGKRAAPKAMGKKRAVLTKKGLQGKKVIVPSMGNETHTNGGNASEEDGAISE